MSVAKLSFAVNQYPRYLNSLIQRILLSPVQNFKFGRTDCSRWSTIYDLGKSYGLRSYCRVKV